ncbi:MAG: RNHCP domain-containing protein [Candidatus Shapirobacteria bacterium]|nr:RNHCP domain-containing protein [Candidatus Shapirobacteria bacterium]
MKRKNFLVPKKEVFTCLNCGNKIEGGGYISHCPKCLWSKHVDQDVPGDRQSDCQGAMKPIEVTKKGKEWRIIHRCQKCNKKTIVYSHPKDDFDLIINLSNQGTIKQEKNKKRKKNLTSF